MGLSEKVALFVAFSAAAFLGGFWLGQPGIATAASRPGLTSRAAFLESKTDPVCGMKVDVAKSTPQSAHRGTKYYFCSAGCKEEFDKNPEKYARDKSVAQNRRTR